MLVLYILLCSRPLNSIGLPFYNSALLSSWTPQLESVKVSTAPMKIPQSVLSAIKMNDGVAYAPLPRELKGRRNMITVAAPKDQGRFRSGKPRSDVSDVVTRVPPLPQLPFVTARSRTDWGQSFPRRSPTSLS
jgi:PAB-dependent poly(A)-specific ribonuclease subunit 2